MSRQKIALFIRAKASYERPETLVLKLCLQFSMALIFPTLDERILLNCQEYSSSQGKRPVGQRLEDNPFSRQGAFGKSKRRLGSDRAIDTTLTRQVSISDAKDEEISTNIATNHIHRFTRTVQKCESNYQTNSNQQNTNQQNVPNSTKCSLNLQYLENNSIANQYLFKIGTKGRRSRHLLFYLDFSRSDKQTCQLRHQHRDREPSRISVTKLRRKLKLIKKNQLVHKNKHSIKHNRGYSKEILQLQ